MLINSTFPRGRKKPDLKDGLSGTSYWHLPSHDFVTGRLWLGRDGDGKPVGIDDNRHIVTVAGSRAGKGTSLIVPNLMLYPGSTVVIDPKGENAALTARHRASLPNHKVINITNNQGTLFYGKDKTLSDRVDTIATSIIDPNSTFPTLLYSNAEIISSLEKKSKLGFGTTFSRIASSLS